MKLFTWLSGRQNSYYEKLTIYSFWRIDCYLIYCKLGCFIGYHTDKIEKGFKHYRLNIRLRGREEPFFIFPGDGKPIFKFWRFIFFRPDIQKHGLGVIKQKTYYLSFGFKVRENEQ